MKHNSVDNSQDILDSRDVIERIEELESERTDLEDALSNAKKALAEAEPDAANLDELGDAVNDAETELSAWDESDESTELKTLQALAEEGEGSPDWSHGEALIRDSYFTEYAQQLAEDIGAISKDQSWPNNHIDWEAAADALKQDYFSVDFDGEEYWIRA